MTLDAFARRPSKWVPCNLQLMYSMFQLAFPSKPDTFLNILSWTPYHRCLKKYCICFSAGIKCDENKCKCMDCGNLGYDLDEEEDTANNNSIDFADLLEVSVDQEPEPLMIEDPPLLDLDVVTLIEEV